MHATHLNADEQWARRRRVQPGNAGNPAKPPAELLAADYVGSCMALPNQTSGVRQTNQGRPWFRAFFSLSERATGCDAVHSRAKSCEREHNAMGTARLFALICAERFCKCSREAEVLRGGAALIANITCLIA